MTWIFVEDMPDEARTFADQLGSGERSIEVRVLNPQNARVDLLSSRITPAGVLMDIDLSAEPGERGTGAGIAQDLRVKQKAREIEEFPIVRFGAIDKIRKYVERDPGSDDLFDLKIQKEDVLRDLKSVQRSLQGLEGIYESLKEQSGKAQVGLDELLGLGEEERARWSQSAFHDRLLSALETAPHVAANVFIRGFLRPTGLLLDERVLSIRLGVDSIASGDSWHSLVAVFGFQFRGAGANQFARWWARGLEDWWFETIPGEPALLGLNINERVEALQQTLGMPGLVALEMPQGSPGDKPWRLCTLSLEEDPPEYVPLDPTEAVRITPSVDQPSWTDPPYAALGPALQARDLRLNRSDLELLKNRYG